MTGQRLRVIAALTASSVLLGSGIASAQVYGRLATTDQVGTFYAPPGVGATTYYPGGSIPPASNRYSSGYSINSAFTLTPGYPPITMTSINYPGVYGAHTYGILPGFQGVTPVMQGTYISKGTTAYGPTAVESNPSLAATSTALVDVNLPADADLRFEGIRVSQPGSLRRFISPPLMPGRNYNYDISATWTDNGRQVTQTRKVLVRAGDHISVDFPTPTVGSVETMPSTLRSGRLP